MTAATRAELAAAARAAAGHLVADLTGRLETVRPALLAPVALLLVVMAGLLVAAVIAVLIAAGVVFSALVVLLICRRGLQAATAPRAPKGELP